MQNEFNTATLPLCPMTNEICNGESCILFNLKLGKCMLPRVTNCLFSIEREVKELRRELHGTSQKATG